MNAKKITGIIVAVIIVGGASFYGGIKYDQSTAKPLTAQAGGFRGRTGAAAGGSVTAGSILSVDPTGITVQLRAGGSKIVFISSSTAITKSVTGAAQDLSTGQQVMVSGQTNSDGSIEASSIQIRPDMASTTSAAATQ